MRRFTVPTVQAGHAIGVDLGGTKILAGVVARDGSVVRRHERPTPQDTQEHVLAELEAAVVELLDDSVAAVGFGAPSPIDQARGVVVRCVNLPLEDAPLRDRMHERFGIASFLNVFAPRLVVLGGGFGVAGFDYLHGPAEEVARREALEPMRSDVRLAKAELGTAAGLIGAAFVGFEALDSA